MVLYATTEKGERLLEHLEEIERLCRLTGRCLDKKNRLSLMQSRQALCSNDLPVYEMLLLCIC